VYPKRLQRSVLLTKQTLVFTPPLAGNAESVAGSWPTSATPCTSQSVAGSWPTIATPCTSPTVLYQPYWTSSTYEGPVGAVEESVLEQEGAAMSQQRVPLHLPKPDPSGPLSSFYWLMGQEVNRTSRTDLELVRYHVPQALVVNHTHEYVRFKFPPISAAIESLIAIVIVAG